MVVRKWQEEQDGHAREPHGQDGRYKGQPSARSGQPAPRLAAFKAAIFALFRRSCFHIMPKNSWSLELNLKSRGQSGLLWI